MSEEARAAALLASLEERAREGLQAVLADCEAAETVAFHIPEVAWDAVHGLTPAEIASLALIDGSRFLFGAVDTRVLDEHQTPAALLRWNVYEHLQAVLWRVVEASRLVPADPRARLACVPGAERGRATAARRASRPRYRA